MGDDVQAGREPPWEDSALTCQQAEKLSKLLEVPGDDGRDPDDVFHIRPVREASYQSQVRMALLLLESLEATQTDWRKLVGTRINDVVTSDVLQEKTLIDDKLGPCLADGDTDTTLDLPNLATLDKQQASYLSRFKGTLLLGVESLDAEVAKGLAAFQGILHLPKLTTLPAQVAMELKGFEGTLLLTGLESISDHAASQLFQCKGTLNVSSLVGLGKEATLQLFSRGDQNWDYLPELEEIDVPLAKAIQRNFQDKIKLPGITSLVPEVAEVFSQSEADLSLQGIKVLDVKTAKFLGSRKGGRLRMGLEQIQPEIAIALSPHHGPVHLPDLKALSTCSARILSKFNLFPVLPEPFRGMVLKENCKLTDQQRLFLRSAFSHSIAKNRDLVDDLLGALPQLGNDRDNLFPTIGSDCLAKLKNLKENKACPVKALSFFLESVGAERGDYICLLKVPKAKSPFRKLYFPILDVDESLNPNILECMLLGHFHGRLVLDRQKSLDVEVAKLFRYIYIPRCSGYDARHISLRGLEHISKDLASVFRSSKCHIQLGSPKMDGEAWAILESAPHIKGTWNRGSEALENAV